MPQSEAIDVQYSSDVPKREQFSPLGESDQPRHWSATMIVDFEQLSICRKAIVLTKDRVSRWQTAFSTLAAPRLNPTTPAPRCRYSVGLLWLIDSRVARRRLPGREGQSSQSMRWKSQDTLQVVLGFNHKRTYQWIVSCTDQRRYADSRTITAVSSSGPRKNQEEVVGFAMI